MMRPVAVRLMMTRSSGVICGVTLRLSTAFLKDVEVAPLELIEEVLRAVGDRAERAGIELAKEAEHGFGHSAGMYSRDIDALSRMARTINTSIFTKNGPFFAGLGEGGEGHTSFTIASPTGEGMTGPVAFSRLRRCVLVDHFRIV